MSIVGNNDAPYALLCPLTTTYVTFSLLQVLQSLHTATRQKIAPSIRQAGI
jgi:hypothetical protein